MKKATILGLMLLGSILFLASCQSHGPKCPGMYSQTETVEMQDIILTENLN